MAILVTHSHICMRARVHSRRVSSGTTVAARDKEQAPGRIAQLVEQNGPGRGSVVRHTRPPSPCRSSCVRCGTLCRMMTHTYVCTHAPMYIQPVPPAIGGIGGGAPAVWGAVDVHLRPFPPPPPPLPPPQCARPGGKRNEKLKWKTRGFFFFFLFRRRKKITAFSPNFHIAFHSVFQCGFHYGFHLAFHIVIHPVFARGFP